MNAKEWMGLAALLAATLGSSPSSAAGPAAIVEDVRGGAVGVAPLDYLPVGKVLHLGPKDELILGYLNSCRREVIRGGTVTVGAAGSTVVGGRLDGGKVPCDNRPRERLGTAAPTGQAPSFTPLAKPEGQPGETGIGNTVYGRSPLFDLGAPGQLTIERLDQPGDPIKLDVRQSDLLRGRFYDFAKNGPSLEAGGIYRASFGGRRIVFWVDALAQSGDAPLLGRLLRL